MQTTLGRSAARMLRRGPKRAPRVELSGHRPRTAGVRPGRSSGGLAWEPFGRFPNHLGTSGLRTATRDPTDRSIGVPTRASRIISERSTQGGGPDSSGTFHRGSRTHFPDPFGTLARLRLALEARPSPPVDQSLRAGATSSGAPETVTPHILELMPKARSGTRMECSEAPGDLPLAGPFKDGPPGALGNPDGTIRRVTRSGADVSHSKMVPEHAREPRRSRPARGWPPE
jgi:hypothetical protein